MITENVYPRALSLYRLEFACVREDKGTLGYHGHLAVGIGDSTVALFSGIGQDEW